MNKTVGTRAEAELQQTLVSLEQSLLNTAVRSDRASLEELLDPGFREVGASGSSYDREQIVRLLLAENSFEVVAFDFEVTIISATAILLHYRTQRRSSPDSPVVLRCSLWVQRGGCWRILYHQGTAAISG